MEKLRCQQFWLILPCIWLLNIGFVQCKFLKFTNISCVSKDNSSAMMEYCYIREVDHEKNYASVRFMILRAIGHDFLFNFRLMIKNKNWQTFYYAADIDLCRFWKKRYNAIAKLIFGFAEGHTNMNHSCPYNEKYLTVDKLMNTDISKKLTGIPAGKGHYAAFTTWSWRNQTRVVLNFYFDILID